MAETFFDSRLGARYFINEPTDIDERELKRSLREFVTELELVAGGEISSSLSISERGGDLYIDGFDLVFSFNPVSIVVIEGISDSVNDSWEVDIREEDIIVSAEPRNINELRPNLVFQLSVIDKTDSESEQVSRLLKQEEGIEMGEAHTIKQLKENATSRGIDIRDAAVIPLSTREGIAKAAVETLSELLRQ